MVILNLSESLAKPLVMAKLNVAYLSSLWKKAKLLSSYLPVSPSRVLRAYGTSPYHSVPEHFRTTRCQAWAISPPPWGLLSQWHRQETTTPETNGASSAQTQPQFKEISRFIKPRITLFHEKRCLNYGKNSGTNGLNKKLGFFYGPISPNSCARRSVTVISNLSESLAKQLVMAKLNMAYTSSLKTRQNFCRPTCLCHYLGYSVPPALHRII